MASLPRRAKVAAAAPTVNPARRGCRRAAPRLCSAGGGVAMADRIQITPLLPHLAASVDGVDLSHMDEPTFRQVFDAFQEHSVLVFHDQRLTDDAQMAFSRRFGPLEETLKAPGKEDRLHKNLVDLSNVDPDQDGKLIDWNDRRMMYQ